jgi:hypothetical protein
VAIGGDQSTGGNRRSRAELSGHKSGFVSDVVTRRTKGKGMKLNEIDNEGFSEASKNRVSSGSLVLRSLPSHNYFRSLL